MKRLNTMKLANRDMSPVAKKIFKDLMDIIAEQSNKRHIVDGKKGFVSLPEEHHLTNRLGVRVTDSEKAIIESNAEALGISMGEYIRAAVKLLDRYEVVES